MVPTISDEDAEFIVRALEHYDAYLKVAKREDSRYRALAERLQRKPVEQELSQTATKRKTA